MEDIINNNFINSYLIDKINFCNEENINNDFKNFLSNLFKVLNNNFYCDHNEMYLDELACKMSRTSFITLNQQTLLEQDLVMLKSLNKDYVKKVIVNGSNESKMRKSRYECFNEIKKIEIINNSNINIIDKLNTFTNIINNINIGNYIDNNLMKNILLKIPNNILDSKNIKTIFLKEINNFSTKLIDIAKNEIFNCVFKKCIKDKLNCTDELNEVFNIKNLNDLTEYSTKNSIKDNKKIISVINACVKFNDILFILNSDIIEDTNNLSYEELIR